MKILIGFNEVCGLINTYKEGFQKLGHEVVTISNSSNKFYPNNKYDYLGSDIGKSYTSNKYLAWIITKVKNKLPLFFHHFILKHKIKKINPDLTIIIWQEDSFMSLEQQYLLPPSKKSIAICLGTDIRTIEGYEQEFESAPYLREGKYPADLNNKLCNLRIAELFADEIYSVPDQSSLAIRPYRHVQLPIDLTTIKFQNSGSDIPLILHAPSLGLIKGTEKILSTLEELKKEGVPFKLKHIKNMPNHELKEWLFKADILVDELHLHGPGFLGFEAMASGCAVATKHLENSPNCFSPPVWSINKDNLKDQLKELITNKKLRNELIEKGKEYVNKNNEVTNICRNLLTNIESPPSYDYIPKFIYNGFTLDQGMVINPKVKTLTKRIVKKHNNITQTEVDILKQKGLI